MTVGERIKKLRTEKHLSADALAEMVGVNRATIYRYENGGIENMSVDVLEPLAKSLGVTPMYLMGWDDSTAGAPSSGSAALDRSEQTLLDNYRQLNIEGQDKLQDYAFDLVASGRYIKDHSHESMVKSA